MSPSQPLHDADNSADDSAEDSPSPQPAAEVPAVILVRPEGDANVGAAARAMANMGLSELILVEPATELGVLGHAFAKGADHIIAKLRRVASLADATAPFQRVVGTTSARARTGGQEIIRPRALPARLATDDPPGTRTALVFGPEVTGLTKDELALCHPLVNVPCDPVQPTLNLAQSVLVLAYELYVARVEAGQAEPLTQREEVAPPAEAGQVDGLFDQLTELLRRVNFDRDDTFDTVVRDMRRMSARAAPSHREVTLMRGMCRRVEYQLDRLDELRQAEAEDGNGNGTRNEDGGADGSADDDPGAPRQRKPHRWSRPGED